ncbi:class I adenylate-forming enzyme family protein [Sphingomonas sp. AOB5]|uniref:class I adenylate-forming enzyme family protein n=1 Tax=Sphingomonas sp. AOB5 TaxID=3034017 RepID=UPI0023F862A0|nr:class I adenylate-forming enzyme family protein [Sphingomonas sp. AOB5]MDF7774823.1 class I adenylate-forming enzyme family protein [Sphingomonas sp. AOB5]
MAGLETTLGAAIDATAAAHGAEPAFIADGKATDYATLKRDSDALAAAMLRDGVCKGDRVGIWLPTSAAWLTIFCAVARIGAIAVPVNTRYQGEEVRHVLTHAGVSLLFAQPRMWRTDAFETLCAISPDLAVAQDVKLTLEALPDLRRIVMTEAHPARAVVALADYAAATSGGPAIFPEVVESDSLLICFTSGSTGRPKGVVHSHRVLRHCRRLAEIQGLKPGERSLANWPLHHAGGLFILLVPTLLSGAAMVGIAQWTGSDALRLIEAERVTVIGGIPTHYLDMIDDPAMGQRDLSSLRYCYMGGANVAGDVFDRIVQALDCGTLPSTYGLTENTVCATFNLPGDPPEWCSRNIAPVVADCEVAIVDPATGESVAAGEPGEIRFRGATVMDGYYNDPDATAAAIDADGWLRTGDLGVLHPNGYLQPTGRLKEMLKVGGSNVSPTEVESVLIEHPAARNAVVVGVPDRRLTEVAFAFVERRPGCDSSEAEIIAFCRPRMADYKVPRHVLLLDELPRLSTGKIDRAVLALQAKEAVSQLVTESGAV